MRSEIRKIVEKIWSLSDKGELDDAIALATACLEEHPIASLYFQRAQLYEGLNQPLKAIHDYTKAAAEDPEHFKYFLFRGDSFALMGRNTEAIRDFHRVLELKPDCPNIHQQLCLCYIKTGQLLQAEEHVGMALSKEPTDWLTHSCQAELRLSMRQFELASQSYLNAIRHSDTGWAECDVAVCWAGVARALRQTQLRSNHQQALEAASTAVDLDPDWLELRAQIHNQVGDRRNAIKDLETALSRLPRTDATKRISSKLESIRSEEQ